ncbi:hypothetical protein AOLI_G00010340 [Acnodon oligacanthus]
MFAVMGVLEPIPAVIRQKTGYTLDRSPVHCREETHADTEKLHTGRTLVTWPGNWNLCPSCCESLHVQRRKQ